MPRKIQRFKSSLLVFVIAVAALAQTASEKPNVDVRRVGARLQCQCGGCKDSVATCSMLECHFSKPAKERIAQMQSVGMSDDQIVQAFVRDYGMAVYLAPPNAFGWIVPYACVGLGLGLILLFIRKYKAKPMTNLGTVEPEDPELAKYQEQIDQDTKNLD